MSIPLGEFGFNTDSTKMEYYDGNQWVNVTSTSPEVQTGGTRGLWAGGTINPAAQDLIDYVEISTTGNTSDFGDLTTATEFPAAGQGSSRTRGIIAGGRNPGNSYTNTVEYVTITSTGDATNFGDLTDARHYAAIMSDGSRAVVAGGQTPTKQDVIDYVQISTTGDATDFGNLFAARMQLAGFSNGHGGLG